MMRARGNEAVSMRILLTGAGGQIGGDLVAALVDAGHDIVATDLHPPADAQRPGPRGEAHPAGVLWEALDVTDAAAVLSAIQRHAPERVYHLAALLSARGERDPQLAYAVNQTGTYNILEACRIAAVRQLMFTSSIAVYGPGLPDPTPDEVPLHPRTIYGATKAAGEMLCDYYARRYGLDARGVRFPGLINAAIPGGGSSDYALFMYVEGVRTGAYTAFCRADTRIPLMYMPDGVRALLELPEAPRSALTRSVYNIAAFSPTAAEIAASVARAIPGVRIGFEPDPVRQGILDSWPRALDDSCARTDWGWRAAYDLEAMTADLIPQVRALVGAGVRLAHD
jgi:nucleoside-diphosphate-sugar epimerase